MGLRSIASAHNLWNKFVLVRLDTNVPMDGKRVVDDTRLRLSLPTIRLLERKGAKIILLGHLGRPSGKEMANLSLRPIGYALGKLLRQPVKVLPLNGKIEAIQQQARQGIVLLENVRFDKGEDKNSDEFALQLARLGQIFVNEAFSCSHRPTATMVTLPKKLPGFAGLNLIHEVAALEQIRRHGSKPVVAVIGGAKIEDKLPVVLRLLPRLSSVLVGGGVANTILKAKGYNLGKSLVNTKEIKLAKQLIRQAGRKMILPIDVIVDNRLTRKAEARWRSVDEVGVNEQVVDLGTETCRLFAKYLKKARTIFWSGPLGLVEEVAWRHGTLALGRLVSAAARRRAYVVVGGGDTAAFFNKYGLTVDFVSTGGGAMLDFLAGEKLPGLMALGYKSSK